MADVSRIGFVPIAAPSKGVLILFCNEGLKYGAATRKLLASTGDLVQRAAAADRFTGKSGSALDILAPSGLSVSRLTVIGAGKVGKRSSAEMLKLGGIARGKVPSTATDATIVAEFGSGVWRSDQVADAALGAILRAYTFDRYKTKRK